MRKILFVTERRADYSRFKPIIDGIIKSGDLDYQLIVTGLHLLKEHGHTIDLIREDGLSISSIIPMYEEGVEDTGAEMVRAMGRFLTAIPSELARLKPDIVFSGFDIGANFALAVAAAHMNIPLAHLQGGELSGSIDESLRHAMSKFAHFHFPANQDAADRLRRMGEDPKNIFVVGCPSLDALLNLAPVPLQDLEQELGMDLSKKFIVIIQHTVTTQIEEVPSQIKETIDAVKSLGVQALLIYPNNDAGSRAIMKAIEHSGIKQVRTLSLEKYATLLKRCSALVGNSSSGIHETASFHVPTVNVGDRQAGRLRPENVIDVPNSREGIKKGIEKALYDETFKKKVISCTNPYGDGHSAEKIVKVLETIPLSSALIRKKFIDV